MSESHIFAWAATHLPFAALIVKPIQDRPLLTRLSEQAIVGLVAAGFALYSSNIRHEDELKTIASTVQELKNTVEQMRRDLYKPIGQNK